MSDFLSKEYIITKGAWTRVDRLFVNVYSVNTPGTSTKIMDFDFSTKYAGVIRVDNFNFDLSATEETVNMFKESIAQGKYWVIYNTTNSKSYVIIDPDTIYNKNGYGELKLDTTLDNALSNIGDLVTIRNIGGTPVSVHIVTDGTTQVTEEYLESLGIDPIEIGGLVFEISNNKNEQLWVKCYDEDGKISIRIKGTIDPSEDITVLATQLNALSIELTQHKLDTTDNPHDVDKYDVGLGNLPNAITNDITTVSDSNKTKVLATAKAVQNIQDNLDAHEAKVFDKKAVSNTNIHGITAATVKLDKVPNFAKATADNCDDPDNDAAFMTPATTYKAVAKWASMTMSVAPQSIVKCAKSERITGWSIYDCSSPSAAISFNGTDIKSYRVNAGLQVAYADTNKTRISGVLNKDIVLNIPGNESSSSIYYVYVNIDDEGNITEANHTKYQPNEGMERTFGSGDFYNVAENVMYDATDKPIRRVYIGRVVLASGIVSEVIAQPVGYECTVPVTLALDLGEEYLLRNPFIGEVDAVAEVSYNLLTSDSSISSWGPTYWNDQVGIKATPYPIVNYEVVKGTDGQYVRGPMEFILLQCGLMGFLACGKESGSPFGKSFATVTTAPSKVRIRYTKRYK